MLIIMKKLSIKKKFWKMLYMMITLTYMELISQDDENILLFWFIYNVLSLLSLINLNVLVINIS